MNELIGRLWLNGAREARDQIQYELDWRVSGRVYLRVAFIIVLYGNVLESRALFVL